MVKTVKELLAALPREAATFEGSDYPLPLCQAVLGEVPSVGEVRERLESTDPDDAAHLGLHVAMAAECCEAGQPDAQDLFVSDAELRGLVFSGAKWRAGWVFLLGDALEGLKPKLEAREFIVFSSGRRATHPVYWLQMMVRYAMTWGQVPPGEDHEMGHFLEDDLPGVLIVRGATCEVESLLALAMMKLGCPAVVPEDFPFEEGRQARASGDEEILDAIATLPNLRVREVEGERIALPTYCDPAYAKEPFEAARTIGGDRRSFFVLRPADVEDGVEIVGTPGASLGVLIEVAEEGLDPVVCEYLERTAMELPGYLPAVRVLSSDPFTLGVRAGGELDPAQLAGVLRAGSKWHFPGLAGIHVKVIFDADELDALAADVAACRSARSLEMEGRTEHTVSEFVACIECQSFSHSHVCIVTPDRPPMCGREPGQVKAAALFGATWHPYRRRGLKPQELREVVPKGRCLDPERGEYEGINEAARRLTDGVIQRVFLHSLNDCPHSSCGCFHYLAFRMSGRGIGVMHRGFEGQAPNGETWDSLANRAGGKQADGITGLSVGYLRSAEFLKGDGGLVAVVWATEKAVGEFQDLLPEGKLPATEHDARTLAELDQFLSSHP